jgi:pectate lyase
MSHSCRAGNTFSFKVLLLLLTHLLLRETAVGALFFADPFNFPDGTQLGAVAGSWNTSTAGYGDNTAQIKVSTISAQTAPNGFASAAFNGVVLKPAASVKKNVAAYNGATGVAATDGNVVCASFLLNVQTLPPSGVTNMAVFILHGSSSSSSGWILEVDVSSTGQIGIQKRGGGITYGAGTPLAASGTHLVVVRYQFQLGADAVALWVDPSQSTYAVNPVPAASATTTAGSDASSAITHVGVVSAGIAAGPEYWIDEVRVGTTWMDVTPSNGQSAPASGPVITQALLSPQGLILRGTNGAPDAAYQVLASTNITVPASSWPSIASRSFDSSGNFDSTNPVLNGAAQQFFRLLIGGTNLPAAVAPSITSPPQSLTVAAGGSATFTVAATGSSPLRYQWYFNTTNALAAATNTTLALNSVSATNAGTYSVLITNLVGAVTSSVASLTVLGPPTITVPPQSQSVALSNDVTFTVAATGTAPLAYRWFFNTTTALTAATSSSLVITNVQATNAGNYSVVITNTYGAVTSAVATLTVSTAAVNLAQFNLVGFAGTATGGGILAETNAAYRKVTNALDLATAIDTAGIKVIEITTNLDLGWLEIGAAAQAVGPFRSHATPSLHPRLIQTGVSLLDIQGKDGLTIFSANGATLKHCCFNLKDSRNVLVRNLKFDEMWEWDEATKGNYDSKDWDFIDLGNGGGTGTTTNIWIDHCTFTKAYDGICDIKGGANHITFSWNRYVGDDGAINPNSFVWQQINTLESNKASYAMYNSLRAASGFTPAEIVTILQGHDKTHLAGANSGVGNAGNAAENALISITFHHQWFQNCWDRCVPRLRGGNVHSFNIYADDALALDAKNLRDAHAINSSYNFNPVLNGSISTEGGAILVENSIYEDCLTPLRNNQTDVTNPAYTGKILALNSIYSLRTAGGATNTCAGSSTNSPGDTYFGPVQAPVIPFSWNLPGGTLPYSYTLTDPSRLKPVLTNAATGCGAGVLTWAKTNWLKTSY